MNIITIAAVFIHLTFTITNDSVYNISFGTIDGNTKSMADFNGRKVMIVVLPVTANEFDTAFINKIDSFSRQYTTLATIVVPSFEDGYNNSLKPQLLDYYIGRAGTQMMVADGMYTHKSSEQQSDLFSWLTHADRNIHFDMDTQGPGQAFFISEQGELVGVLGPETQLTDNLIQRMLQ